MSNHRGKITLLTVTRHSYTQLWRTEYYSLWQQTFFFFFYNCFPAHKDLCKYVWKSQHTFYFLNLISDFKMTNSLLLWCFAWQEREKSSPDVPCNFSTLGNLEATHFIKNALFWELQYLNYSRKSRIPRLSNLALDPSSYWWDGNTTSTAYKHNIE